MEPTIRFSSLVRKGLRFRDRFDAAKTAAGPVEFAWYPYDSFVNLFYLQKLMRGGGRSLESMAGGRAILDIGAADGALSFYAESLGFAVDALDCSGCNINRMCGIRQLARQFESKVRIHDIDLDGRFEFPGQYGLTFGLGTLYHLKNPYYFLEKLSQHSAFCFLSTRVARWSPDGATRLEGLPVAYLLGESEINSDATNYWIFSPAGLTLLVERAGWSIEASVCAGPSESNPVASERDERMYLMLRSRRAEVAAEADS